MTAGRTRPATKAGSAGRNHREINEDRVLAALSLTMIGTSTKIVRSVLSLPNNSNDDNRTAEKASRWLRFRKLELSNRAGWEAFLVFSGFVDNAPNANDA
ncbi:MAG: hypothetical protein O2960_05265 [Verrucomicrobia bacterium]|nr:hypothetical protein [Verrucomicrobiota bacterium]